MRSDDVSTIFSGIVRILKHTRLTVGQVLPQRQVRITHTNLLILRTVNVAGAECHGSGA